MPRDYASDLGRALARDTPAFQAPPQPASAGQSFFHQLLAALARVTPAFRPTTAHPRDPAPEAGAAARPRRTRMDRIRERNVKKPYTPSGQRSEPPEKWARRYRRVDPGRLLTVAEVASLMQVRKTSVYRLVHSGHLPAVRYGRSFRVPEGAVHEYLRDSVRNMS
jgi:excisionase family DNA binding protein